MPLKTFNELNLVIDKKPAIIIDIDGTLANCDHRRHFVDGTHEKKDWEAFYGAMDQDTVNQWCYLIITSIYSESHRQEYAAPPPDKINILFVSGRPEEHRRLTEQWMDDNINYLFYERGFKLFMRNAGDFRDDAIIKKEIYQQLIEPFYNILFVIDDRKKVVDMWRSLGLVCLQCADGNF